MSSTATQQEMNEYLTALPGRRHESLAAATGYATFFKGLKSPELAMLMEAESSERRIRAALWEEKRTGKEGVLSAFPADDADTFFRAVDDNIERLSTVDQRFAEMKRLRAVVKMID